MKQPAMRIDLFAVLLLQAKHQLHRRQVASDIAVLARADELLARGYRDLAGEFENVSHGFLTVDVLLHDAVLIYSNRREYIKDVLVDLIDAIKDQTDHDLLPSRAALIPESRLLQIDDVANILHSPVERSGKEDFILIIVRDGDHELCVPIVHPRA